MFTKGKDKKKQLRQLPFVIKCYDLYECNEKYTFYSPFYQCGNESGLTVGNWQGGKVLVAICRQTNCWGLVCSRRWLRLVWAWLLRYLVKSQETNWAKLLWSGGKVFCSRQNFFIYLSLVFFRPFYIGSLFLFPTFS